MRLCKTSILTAVLGLLLTINIAIGSEQDGQWYVNGLATYINPDSDLRLKDEIAGGELSLGRALSEHWNVEGAISLLDVSGKNGASDADFVGGTVNGMYLWNRESIFTPYLLGGIGALNIDRQGSDSTNLQLQAGPGFLLDLWTERLALRAEVLGRWANSNPEASDILVNVGLQFAFGDKRRAPVAAMAAAPLAAVAAKAAAPKDSDSDGIMDGSDKCPGTPAGVVVDAKGCGIDSDGDSYPDGIDKCPNSIRNALVDNTGCAFRLSGANFATNSADLTSDGKKQLSKAADLMRKMPGLNVTIEGYTDSRGAAAYNLDLSKRRAQAAKDYLVSQNVEASRLTAVGFGEASPVASNDTDKGQAANRRVVLKVDD